MGMIIHSASHLDHGLSDGHIKWILRRFASKSGFFIETVNVPRGLGSLPCALHGPSMGDGPVSEKEVFYDVRGGRKYASRLVRRSPRQTRKLTVVAGPYDGNDCVLFTAYGGPASPREPMSPGLNPKETRESMAFWKSHALSA